MSSIYTLVPQHQLPPMGLGECLVGEEEIEMVTSVLRSRALFRHYGPDPDRAPPMVAQLEREFAAAHGVRFALGVTSGTAALEVALGALGIGHGDEVIIPVWSWISCFTAVVRVGARPVLAEVDDTLTIDPDEIPRLASPRTKAVLVVHYQGVAADLDRILKAAASAGIKVIEDCAESAGAVYRGRRVGSWGDIGTFSFQARKVITSGEGGMVITNDSNLYERAVRMSDIGQYRPFHQAIQPGVGTAFSGSNYRMSELTGAVALVQFRRLDGMILRLRGLRARLMAQIKGLTGVAFRRIPDETGDLGFETYLFLGSADACARVRESLNTAGVGCTQHTGTYCHYARPYCQTGATHDAMGSPFRGYDVWPAVGYRAEDFPKTNALISRMIAIPIGALHSDADIDYIASALRRAAG